MSNIFPLAGFDLGYKPAKTNPIRVQAEILWESRNHLYAVIKGPFPQGLSRTETRRTLEAAIKMKVTGPRGIMARSGTEKPHYAKVLRCLVDEVSNQWGEVCP